MNTTVGIVGCGILGSAIAAELTMSGINTFVYAKDASEAQITDAVNKHYASCFSSGLLGQDTTKANEIIEAAKSNLFPVTSMKQAVERADFIFEAIFEVVEQKKEVYREIELYAKENAIIGTNTLTLGLKTLSDDMQHKERFVGVRFLYPVTFIQFVEVTICNEISNQDASESVANFLSSIGKCSFLYHDQHDVFQQLFDSQEIANTNELRSVLQMSGLIRLKLTSLEVTRHQARESRLRLQHDGVQPIEDVSNNEQESLPSAVCVVCWDKVPNAVIVSCGHKAFCLECAQQLNTTNAPCPLCRATMRGVYELVKNKKKQ